MRELRSPWLPLLLAAALRAASGGTVVGVYHTDGQGGIDTVTVEQSSMHGDTANTTASLVDRLVEEYGLGQDAHVSLSKLMRATPSPTARHYPGGYTAKEWDDALRNALDGQKFVADAAALRRNIIAGSHTPDATPAPTPVRMDPELDMPVQNVGKFTYRDGRVELLCPPGKRLLESNVTHGAAPAPGRCIMCRGGRYQPRRGAKVCFLCPPGKYNPAPAGGPFASGHAACRACPGGRYQPAAGATFCHDDRLRGLERMGNDGRLEPLIAKPHYQPAAALGCCTEKCMSLQVTADEAAQRVWQRSNPSWQHGEPFFVPVTDADAKHDCKLGCSMWMRHSSLNWGGSHMRLQLLDRCNKDCKDARFWARQGQVHLWTPGGAQPSTPGGCMVGCKHYLECQIEQDQQFASVQLMSGGGGGGEAASP